MLSVTSRAFFTAKLMFGLIVTTQIFSVLQTVKIYFQALATERHSGEKLRSAIRRDQFIGMFQSQLSGRQSLRDIRSNLEAQQRKLYHLGAKPISKSTLARLNSQ